MREEEEKKGVARNVEASRGMGLLDRVYAPSFVSGLKDSRRDHCCESEQLGDARRKKRTGLNNSSCLTSGKEGSVIKPCASFLAGYEKGSSGYANTIDTN